jgi:hypothetical protein
MGQVQPNPIAVLGDAPHICSLSVRYQSSTYPLPSSFLRMSKSYCRVIDPAHGKIGGQVLKYKIMIIDGDA